MKNKATMDKAVDRTLNCDFTYIKGEMAGTILEEFAAEARAQGWLSNEVALVIREAIREDDNHLWKIICLYSETPK